MVCIYSRGNESNRNGIFSQLSGYRADGWITFLFVVVIVVAVVAVCMFCSWYSAAVAGNMLNKFSISRKAGKFFENEYKRKISQKMRLNRKWTAIARTIT